MPVTLMLLTRKECHLCEQARQAMQRVGHAVGVSWWERDVDTDAELSYEYGDRVPVVLLRGVEHSFWRVDEARLIADLGG
ncbi:MAG: glutaredoxin family protein [Acidimicrobiales bacterium]|nr:MAG: glutaredoxin family protein [Acidimicrobiales bacterium]